MAKWDGKELSRLIYAHKGRLVNSEASGRRKKFFPLYSFHTFYPVKHLFHRDVSCLNRTGILVSGLKESQLDIKTNEIWETLHVFTDWVFIESILQREGRTLCLLFALMICYFNCQGSCSLNVFPCGGRLVQKVAQREIMGRIGLSSENNFNLMILPTLSF